MVLLPDFSRFVLTDIPSSETQYTETTHSASPDTAFLFQSLAVYCLYMKLFDKVRGKIGEVDGKGRGIMWADGKSIATPFVIPRDEITVTLTKRRRGELTGRLEIIHSPSPHRVTPRCPYAGKCGGCPWQMIDYPKQLEYKRDLVNRAFERTALPFRITDVEPSSEIFYFRNRMDYVFGANGELGLKEPSAWWSVLDLGTCFLLSENAVRVMERVRAWAQKHVLAPWDNKKYTGLLRYLVIREGKFTGERCVTLVTSAEAFPDAARDDLVAELKNFATTIYWGVNPEITDLSIASEMKLLYGKRYLTERVGDFTFDIHPNSFFQTNAYMAARLMETVRLFAELEPHERLLDLYCGVGFFAIGLAASCHEVIANEIDHLAIDLTKENAARNKITNATFLQGATEYILPKMPRPDVVILDPPRSGIHPKALGTLLAFAPKRIVYVSCNYEALARELPTFLRDYEVTNQIGLDLFPHTPHVEVVTQFKKKIRG